MKKDTIIAIVGDSGAGKTTLGLYLEKELGIRGIRSYTTRPMRDGEKQGVEHLFMSQDTKPPKPSERVAYTWFGGHHYWTEHSQIEGCGICTYVIDERGLLDLMENYPDRYRVVAIRIKRPYNDIGGARRERDRCRVHIPDESFDMVFINDGTLEDFLDSVTPYFKELRDGDV